MFSHQEFRQYAHEMVDWIADYLEKIEEFPVKPMAEPGALRRALPDAAPEQGEPMEVIWADFQRLIPPGLLHWQHPGFMALFPSNNSYPSILGEMLAAGVGINAMMWDTSPAATELEEQVLEWLRAATGLPEGWKGVIQDTASASTLTAILTARERSTQFRVNTQGFVGSEPLVLYCSEHTHYSIEKGAKAAGFGSEHVVKIPVDGDLSLRPDLLERRIQEDIAAHKKPCIVVATLGTTGTLAFDPLRAIGEICKRYDIWLHVDAAYAGSAFILPEYRYLLDGIELADSYVFNAHKWLFTNFDCSCYYVKDPQVLINTFSSNPDYLKRTVDTVSNFKDWGLPLGRRFRALKVWFVLRSYGMEGLRAMLREHIAWASEFRDALLSDTRWQLMAPPQMNMLCVRFVPQEGMSADALNTYNEQLLQRINAGGHFYLSGTRVNGQFIIRVVPANTRLTRAHLTALLDTFRHAAA